MIVNDFRNFGESWARSAIDRGWIGRDRPDDLSSFQYVRRTPLTASLCFGYGLTNVERRQSSGSSRPPPDPNTRNDPQINPHGEAFAFITL